ncbi:hypothetical protein [Actinophytocola gossypii]|uniref:DUF4190 domain-containing protein n=1 Tax=Actinophytocola gossypii TaxID=2812003 RepID=A0ABT2JB61_9PSEU|nr:hypothetical protein [Actinophytocola gossypii]MCT2584809.1 hypothetical protein [Actinophytocola gossypii]
MTEESDTLELPARDRRGKLALLGPISLGVAVLSWLTPFLGIAVAAVAIILGVVSIVTRREYRIDWTAVAGISVGGAQLFFEVVLLAIGVSGL